MIYKKEDAVMTRGLAILAMVVLHLFCRRGEDVFGTPLLWVNETTPLVYYFGFFAEICVPIYSLCAGYARALGCAQGRETWRGNLKRILRLMENYWIILVLFSILGLIFDRTGSIPGTPLDFLKSVFLLHSYNGAWWYLNTYILTLLIPASVLLLPVKKLRRFGGFAVFFGYDLLWYLIERLGLWPSSTVPVIAFVLKEANNLLGILAWYWAGAYICKENCLDRAAAWIETHIRAQWQKPFLLLCFAALFIGFNLLQKYVLAGTVGVLTFFLFNLWKKSANTKKVFLFLGKHSTNIWLVHMFFYMHLFRNLVSIVQFPVFELLFLLLLSLFSSYLVFGISWSFHAVFNRHWK